MAVFKIVIFAFIKSYNAKKVSRKWKNDRITKANKNKNENVYTTLFKNS